MSDYERIEKVIRYLEKNYRQQPSLAELARTIGLSEFHFHRLFSRWAGTTPKSFLKALTAEHAKQLLKTSRDLLSVSLESGLSGPSRLHDLLVSVEGVSPGEFKSAGEGLKIHYGTHDTPFGPCLIALTQRGICHLSFISNGESKKDLLELEEKWPAAKLQPGHRVTAELVSEIFGSTTKKRPPPLVAFGTPFQLKVWKALLSIPPGHVLTYGDIARQIGQPKASRAVGSAVARNTIAYLIPCHRVIRETGVIGDYRWGRIRKQAILAYESEEIARAHAELGES